MMIAGRDGSTHVLMGDAIRIHEWSDQFPRLSVELGDGNGGISESFTVVITNPPFGEDLKIKAADAKTNFYMFEKVGNGPETTDSNAGADMFAINAPSWFAPDKITVLTAPTCGLAKRGRLLPRIDDHGQRIYVKDPEIEEDVVDIDDVCLADVHALVAGERTPTMRDVPVDDVSMRAAVPVYYDRRHHERFVKAMHAERFANFDALTIGELIETKAITVLSGHGSPGQEERVGDVPYIKVSDLRAGLVNINPTNRVPRRVAQSKWRGATSGLEPFDVLSPERTSKNIGDFCLLMPGQERVVLTKEIIVMRPGPAARFDSFYLLWALTLKIVREQWKRVVFMQTNREDVGNRWREIEIPVAHTREIADDASQPFRTYSAIAFARTTLGRYLRENDEHHFFVSGAETPEPEAQAAAAAEVAAEDALASEVALSWHAPKATPSFQAGCGAQCSDPQTCCLALPSARLGRVRILSWVSREVPALGTPCTRIPRTL
jgi:hypothetical protein